MKLSVQQEKSFNAWLSSHGINAECPACKSVRKEPLQFVASATLDPVSRLPDFYNVVPFVQMLCSDCGHAQFFNAKLSGLLP